MDPERRAVAAALALLGGSALACGAAVVLPSRRIRLAAAGFGLAAAAAAILGAPLARRAGAGLLLAGGLLIAGWWLCITDLPGSIDSLEYFR